MFCSNCGQKTEPGVRFCGGCGSATETPTLGGKGSSPKLLKLLAVLGGVLAVLVVLVIVVSGGRGPHSSPEALVEAFLKAFEKGDVVGILPLIDVDSDLLKGFGMTRSEQEKNIEGFLTWDGKQYLQAMKEGGTSVDWVVGKARIDNGTANVVVAAIVKDEEEYTLSFYAIKRNGKWYVDSQRGFLYHMFF